MGNFSLQGILARAVILWVMVALLHTAIVGLPPARIGKVREVYDLGSELLIVATDRISAFDAVMANGIPEKGRILTQLSAFWFEELKDVCPNHFLSVDNDTIQSRLADRHPELDGRTTLARKAVPLSIECVVRGYISGSLYKEYLADGSSIHGLDLPLNLQDSEQLPEPIFTPATKAQAGHDENISFDRARDLVGDEVAQQAREWSLELFRRASRHCANVGLILADTKFEFGLTEAGLILIDEALTPDSSRFWAPASYEPGRPQPSYDKQFVRDYLERTGWNKLPPGPELPDEIVQKTRAKYLEAFRMITGRPLID